MTVFCDSNDCIHNGLETGDYKCQCELINLYSGECDAYQSFCETAEYQEQFYKQYGGERIGLPDGAYKLAAKGKRILYNGLIFFTECDDRCPDDEILVTERTTGAIGRLDRIKEHFEKVQNFLKNFARVDDLPEIEIDPTHCAKYRLKQPASKESGVLS